MGTRYLVLALFITCTVVADENNDDFADYLFEKGEYEWASLEYERLQYMKTADTTQLPVWEFRCGKSLMLAGKYHEAYTRFSKIRPVSPLSDSSCILSALCAIRYGDFHSARTRLECSSLDLSEVTGAYLDMQTKDYAAAHKRLRKVADDSPDAFRARALDQVITDIEQFKPKQYAPALLLSLLPGAGHLYSNNKGDALMTFIVVSTGALITGYYHHFGSEKRAITAGTVTGLFYLGGIYGSALSVKIYNKKQRRKYHSIAENVLFGK